MKVHKIHKNYEFRIVYGKGKCFSSSLFIMYVYKNKKNFLLNRLGISVSKKVGKSVTRNRVRRLVYEVYRLNSHKLKNGYDIVFISRNRFYPTCSNYAIEAYKKYNFFKATFLTFTRILRCNRFSKGGYDPLK